MTDRRAIDHLRTATLVGALASVAGVLVGLCLAVR